MSKAFQYKVVLLGDAAVGKSSILLRLTKNAFSEHSESTIGSAYVAATIETAQNVVKFEIWDTAGQERYGSLAAMFYRNAAAAVVVYDITSMSSFERACKWIDELKAQPDANVLIALVGNKVDMENYRRVPTSFASDHATKVGATLFESSAKTGFNVPEIFQYIAEQLPQHELSSSKKSSVTIVDTSNENEKKGCC